MASDRSGTRTRTRSDTRTFVIATLAILVFGLVVAGTILAVTGRAKTPEVKGPIPFGFAKSLKTKVKTGGPVAYAGTTGDTGFWLAIEHGELVALKIRKPGTSDCNVRWAGSVDSFLDCNGKKVKIGQLARYRTDIPKTGDRKGNLLVNLRETISATRRRHRSRPPLTARSSDSAGGAARNRSQCPRDHWPDRRDRRGDGVQLHERRARRGRCRRHPRRLTDGDAGSGARGRRTVHVARAAAARRGGSRHHRQGRGRSAGSGRRGDRRGGQRRAGRGTSSPGGAGSRRAPLTRSSAAWSARRSWRTDSTRSAGARSHSWGWR